MKTLLPSLTFLIVLFITSCGNTENIDKPDTITKEAILVDSFEELGKSDDIKINESNLQENILTLNVSYSGGCKTHEFTLAGLKAIGKSSPPMRSVRLHHNSNEDFCREVVTESISFNIMKLGYNKGEEIRLRIAGVGNLSYTL